MKKRNFILKKNYSYSEIVADFLTKLKKQSTINFDVFYRKKHRITELSKQRILSLEVGFNSAFNGQNRQIHRLFPQKINKVVLSVGRKPRGVLPEVVLNKKFADFKNITLGQHIKFLNKKFKVVGFGDSSQNISLDFVQTFAIQDLFNFRDSEKNLFRYIGIVYVNAELFAALEKANIINNYDNKLYFRINKVDLKQFDRDFRKIMQREMNFVPGQSTFNMDMASGLKKNFSFIELMLFLGIFLFIFFFTILFFVYLVSSAIKKGQNTFFFLHCSGYSSQRFAWLSAIIHFGLFTLAVTLGYCLGFFLNNNFLAANNRMFFTILVFRPFNLTFYLGLIFAFAGLFSVIAYFFTISFVNRVFIDRNNKFSQNNLKVLPLRRTSHFFRAHFFRFGESIKSTIFALLFFRDFGKKCFILIFINIIFILSFILVFAKISSDNFLFGQLSYLNKSVTSFTYFKNSGSAFVNASDNRIYSSVSFVPVSELQKRQKQGKMNPLRKMNLEEVLQEINEFCLLGPSLKQVVKNASPVCFMASRFIDQNTVENEAVRKNMQSFGIEQVYFNVSPYIPEIDYLTLLLKFRETAKNLNGNVFFLSRG